MKARVAGFLEAVAVGKGTVDDKCQAAADEGGQGSGHDRPALRPQDRRCHQGLSAGSNVEAGRTFAPLASHDPQPESVSA
jgi:hypothetical protein